MSFIFAQQLIFVDVIPATILSSTRLNFEQIQHIWGLLDDFEDFRWSHFKVQIRGKNFHLNCQCMKVERLIDTIDIMVKKNAIAYSEKKTIMSLRMIPKICMKRQQSYGLENTSGQSNEWFMWRKTFSWLQQRKSWVICFCHQTIKNLLF